MYKKIALMLLVILNLTWLYCVPVKANTAYATGPHIEVELLSEHRILQAGQTVVIGVYLRPEAEWHTYWRNPGDSGEAPVITINSEPELSFGDIQWPIPKGIPVAHLVNYGYESENLLVVEAKIPENVSAASVEVNAQLSWLVCKEDCIPGSAELSLIIPIGDNAETSEHADLFRQTRALWPNTEHLEGVFEANQSHLVVEVDVSQVADIDPKLDWQLFPFATDSIDHAAPQRRLVDGGKLQFVIPKSLYFNANTEQLQWLVSNGKQGYYLTTQLNTSAMFETGAPAQQMLSTYSLGVILFMAFLGGLILNVMPCVLPVLSIKALALQQDKGSLWHQSAYLMGVMISFNVFAILIIALQATGEQIGWGFHMQHPSVVVSLSFLFTFIALVLFDALQVGSRLAGVGQGLVGGSSFSSHFATGVLAVIVASPCTAPFMAAALGVALVSEAHVSLLVFNALGIGFALPMTLIFSSSSIRKRLPKPGQWMVTLKHLLAFPMLATVAWLCFVYLGQTNSAQQFVLLLCLVGFALFIYILNHAGQKWLRTLAMFGVLFTLVLPIVLSNQTVPKQNANQGDALRAVAYSPVTLKKLQAEGQVVVVNMTADWCITCKVNEQVAFTNGELQAALQQDGVTYMVGDWTNKNTEILDYLTRYQRAGVPLYVVYAGDKSFQVLPQILTPTIVLDAIAQAKQELP